MPQETHGNREDPNDVMPHEPPYTCKKGHSFMQTAVGCVACLPQVQPEFNTFSGFAGETSQWSTINWTVQYDTI